MLGVNVADNNWESKTLDRQEVRFEVTECVQQCIHRTASDRPKYLAVHWGTARLSPHKRHWRGLVASGRIISWKPDTVLSWLKPIRNASLDQQPPKLHSRMLRCSHQTSKVVVEGTSVHMDSTLAEQSLNSIKYMCPWEMHGEQQSRHSQCAQYRKNIGVCRREGC